MPYLSSFENQQLLERFLRYVRIWTTSDSQAADRGIQPSTERQGELARVLADELRALGAEGVQVTEHCYVYAALPASAGAGANAAIPPVCLLAHIDTVEEVSGERVNPCVHEHYDGKKITLASGDVLDPAVDAHLAEAARNGETVITSDGNTLLGADDKAGVAAIMAAAAHLSAHTEIPHGKIEIVFSPDEETGHGMDNVPLALIESKRAYTVDGGHIGELETECFNAYKSEVTFTGVPTHTGSARAGMVNAISMAAAFVSSLPRHEAPETTDGYQGFYAPMGINGTLERAAVTLFLRDFTKGGMERRKLIVEALADAAALSHGGKAEVRHTFQYANMKNELDKRPEVAANLVAAYRAAGVEPVPVPIRGGTDGARLTEMGIPTPNIFTGGHNYHSRTEWCSLEQMAAAAEVLIHLVQH